MNNAVVISEAPKLNYMHNYVSLPYYYGEKRYFERPDIVGIRKTVYKNLDTLDREIGFKKKFEGKKVLIKPNLVAVMLKTGTRVSQVPQTTDPRVFEAVISYLKELTDDIVIVESAGIRIPTTYCYEASGIDRIAKYYNTGLIALEEQLIDHYYLPKAEIQKDVYIPRILSEVIQGKALYVSVPKMKTNLYTGVTLGFKNAMGTLPGSMRYRNHTWRINKKLVDLLYLFKPDLTIIDGIIGGEGCTPAPVDPVRVGTIISGTNAVETDRITTYMMGVDPDENELIKEAVSRNFGDPNVKIIGESVVTKFRKADASLLSDRFLRNWPNVKFLVGYTSSRVKPITSIKGVTTEMVREMEKTCIGGCLSTIAMFFEMLYQGKVEYSKLAICVVLGNGANIDGKNYWFDYTGKAYDTKAIKEITLKKIAIGFCTKEAGEVCDISGKRCGDVNEVVDSLGNITKAKVPLLSINNDYFGMIAKHILLSSLRKRKVSRGGGLLDIPFDSYSDQIFEIRKLSKEDSEKDWIFIPIKKLNKKEIKKNINNDQTISH